MFLHFLKKAVPVPDLDNFSDYLFVGPHPDDIEVSCAKTVAKLTKSGKNVAFVIATNGCVGSVDKTFSSEQLVELRQAEALASAKLLGVQNVVFLPFNDGDDYNIDDMAKGLCKAILDVKPQVVFCPDHTCPSECHPDHVNVGKATTKAVFWASWDKLSARVGLGGSVENINLAYYFTHKPNAYVKVPKSDVRRQALQLHKSQFTSKQLDAILTYFNLREIRLGLKSGKGRAEGYRALSPTQQHCFPEVNEY